MKSYVALLFLIGLKKVLSTNPRIGASQTEHETDADFKERLTVVRDYKKCLAENNGRKVEPEERKDWDEFIGDEVPSLDDILLRLKYCKRGRREKRKAINFDQHPRRAWPSHTIKYKIDSGYTDAGEVEYLRTAIRHVEAETCFIFEEVPESEYVTENHIRFKNEPSGCWSNMGMQSGPEQTINLMEAGCISVMMGKSVHEILHTLGLYHEQERYDRDDYITVHLDNVQSMYLGGFQKRTTDEMNTYEIEYDYSSVMHYGTKYASSNGLPTITSKDPLYEHNMGNVDGMTFFDSKLINTIYCQDECTTQLNCTRGGYTDPNDCNTCRCVEGFMGLCQDVMPSDAACPGAGVVPVTSSDWSCLTLGRYSTGRSCNWLLQAQADKRIDFKFDENEAFDVFCGGDGSGNPCFHYVEVNYKEYLQKRGPRFCCKSVPDLGDPGYLTSDLHEIMVTFRSVAPVWGLNGFTMCFRVSQECIKGTFGDNCEHDATCLAVRPGDRENCGFPKITKQECLDKGCCYDNTYRRTFWCFNPLSVWALDIMENNESDECLAARDGVRTDCGYKRVTQEACNAMGCCYHEQTGVPWCFYPQY